MMRSTAASARVAALLGAAIRLRDFGTAHRSLWRVGAP